MHNCKYDAIKNVGVNWFNMWKYYRFAKRFLFTIPAFTKKLRVLFKESTYGYFGMKNIVPLVRS